MEPDGWAGRLIVVSPVAGSTFWIFKDGMTKAREQDWVFRVLKINWMGCPPGAVERAGV